MDDNDWKKFIGAPDVSQARWKVQHVTKNKERCMMVPYLSTSDVINILNEIAGVGGWSTEFVLLPDKDHVECRLTIDGVTKSNVGTFHPDGVGDKLKSAYSDALKRAASLFGIGNHFSDIEGEWVDFDAQTNRPLQQPGKGKRPTPPPRENKARPPQPQRKPPPQPQPQKEGGTPPATEAPLGDPNAGFAWLEQAMDAQTPTVGMVCQALLVDHPNSNPFMVLREKFADSGIDPDAFPEEFRWTSYQEISGELALQMYGWAVTEGL